MQDGYSTNSDHDAHGTHQQSQPQQLLPHQQYAMSMQSQQFAQQQQHQQQQAAIRYQQNASHNPLQVLYQAAAGSIFYPQDPQQPPLHIGQPAHAGAGQMSLAAQFPHPGHNGYHQPQVSHAPATGQTQAYSYDAPGSTSATHAPVPAIQHSSFVTQTAQNTQPAFSQGSYQEPAAFMPTTDSTTVMPTIPHAQTLHHPISAGNQYLPVQAPVVESYDHSQASYHTMQGGQWSAQAHPSTYETTQPPPLQHRVSGSSAASRSGTSDGIIELESPMTVIPATRAGQAASRSPYSATGFDFLTLLAAVVNRDNSRAARKIQLPEVDLSVSFLAVDCHAPDMPIVYASPTFLALTGYSRQEVIHRNCRFLQSPTGFMQKGDARSHTEAHLVGEMSQFVGSWDEIQVHLTNYRKGGQAFENMVTIIPIPDPAAPNSDPDAGPRYLIGFQVDVTFGFQADEHIRNNSFIGNFSIHGMPRAPTLHEDNFAGSADLHAILGTTKGDDLRKMVYNILVEHNTDFILALSLEGGFMSSSPVFCRLLGYTMEQLGQRTLLDLCNPMDAAPLQTTIKAVSKLPEGSPAARLLFRVRIGPILNPPPSADQFAWVECTAQKHPEQTKSKQSILVSGRRVTLPPMPSGPVSGIRAWAFLDSRGTVLYSGPSSRMMTEDEFLLVDTGSFGKNAEQPPTSTSIHPGPSSVAAMSGMSAGPSQPASSHESSRSGSSTRTSVIAPPIGRPFWEIAADREGQEALYKRILHAPPNGMPDSKITLVATQEPAVVSLSMTNGRFLAIVRDPNATVDGQQLGAGELDVSIPKAWKAQLAELQSETLELRRQLEDRKRAPVLGKRQRD